MPKRLIAGLATMVLAASLAAQRPVIQVGGSTPNFTDLPQAVAAAAPGTIINVWPGVYTGFDCSKPLQVILNGATVTPAAGSLHTIHVHSITGSDAFVIKSYNGIIAPSLLASVRINNMLAPVVIESLTVVGATSQPAIDIYNTGAVHIARSILGGFPGLQAQFTNLVTNECVIGNTIGPGAVVSDATLDSSRSIFVSANQPALRVFDTTARLASDGTGSMLVFGTPSGPVSAFEASDSTVFWDPSRFSLLPANGAPAFLSVMTTEVIEDVPMINAGPAVVGGTASVRMAQATPALGMIAAGYLRPTPIVLGPVAIYPDPTTYFLAAAGVVDQAGLVFNYQIPNDPLLHGLILCFQGLTFLANGSSPVSGAALWYIK